MQSARKIIGVELDRFEEYFQDTVRSDVPLLNRVMKHVTRRKGKQMRPMLVLLCARMGGEINDRSYRAALFVELLHTSSLIHDDLVDDSLERRGAASVNALWKNRTAVFVGDHLFTKSVLLLLSNGDYPSLKIYSDALGKIIEGELVQLEKSSKLNIKEDVYFNIIKGKTATLLAACCSAGASSTFSEEEPIRRMYQFGEKLGIAFQLKDDLMDYGHADIGKPTGNDIREKKITLPLIYTLNNCEAALRKKILYILRHRSEEREMVDFVIEEVVRAGGIRYAEEKMYAFRAEALAILYKFPESETRAAIEELVHYTTERNH